MSGIPEIQKGVFELARGSIASQPLGVHILGGGDGGRREIKVLLPPKSCGNLPRRLEAVTAAKRGGSILTPMVLESDVTHAGVHILVAT